MTRRAAGWLIPVLGLLFFADLVLHPSQTLYSDCSDLFPLHLSSKHFLVRSWKETGELPLWVPFNFGGMPFLHDIQVSAFYPPHWCLFLLPEEWLGAGLSWLVVLHVIAAGWCMWAYARHQGLQGPAALVAALGYMFAGKWLLHLLAGGHYNLVPLAWLPLVLLWLEQAIERGSLVRATWAGAAFALLVLGAYPYVTLYAGLFIALWTLGPATSNQRGTRGLVRWAGFGTWMALIAVALGAVQLLPGLEVAAEASRSAGVSITRDTLLSSIQSLSGLIGPPLSDEPNIWENRAGVGLVWFVLACLAPLLGGRRTRFEAKICLVLLGFALGGAALLQWLPGFRLFRLPSRMILVAALPISLLAGRSVQALTTAEGLPLTLRQRCRTLLVKITVVVLLLAGVFALAIATHRHDMSVRWHPYWITLAVTVPAAYWLLGHRPAFPGTAWVVILGIDLVALTWPLVAVRPEAEIFKPSACVRYLEEQRDKHGRVLDFNPEEFSANHTPLWPGLPVVRQVEAIRGFNPIDVLRYKEYLQFLTDADEPLQAIDGMFTGPILGTFPIVNESLADLLGIRYLVQPVALPLESTVQDPAGRKQWTRVVDDPAPSTFNFVSVQPGGSDCGVQSLPPYQVYENQRVLPRAFVVPEAAPLPARAEVLATLKATDFRRRVLLEDFEAFGPSPKRERANDHSSLTLQARTAFRLATVREYLPNRITLEVESGPAGYLVLTDVWFPGWTCSVDGQSVPVHRANFLFRGVALPEGARQVVFSFAPASLAWGTAISLWSLVAVIGLSLLPLRKWLTAPQASQPERKTDAVYC
jgi:hypothetical protein